MLPTRSSHNRFLLWLRSFTVPYLSVMVAVLATSRIISYVYRGDFTLLGKPPSILVVLVGAFPSAAVWIVCERSANPARRVQRSLLAAGLLGFSVFTLTLFQWDAFNYVLALTLAIIVAITLKTPSSYEAWKVIFQPTNRDLEVGPGVSKGKANSERVSPSSTRSSDADG